MRYSLLTYFLKAWLIIYYSPSIPDPVDSVSSNSGKAIHSSKNLIQNAGLAYFLFCEGWKMDLWKPGSLSKRDSWSREICSIMFAVRRGDLFHPSVVFARISAD